MYIQHCTVLQGAVSLLYNIITAIAECTVQRDNAATGSFEGSSGRQQTVKTLYSLNGPSPSDPPHKLFLPSGYQHSNSGNSCRYGRPDLAVSTKPLDPVSLWGGNIHEYLLFTKLTTHSCVGPRDWSTRNTVNDIPDCTYNCSACVKVRATVKHKSQMCVCTFLAMYLQSQVCLALLSQPCDYAL